MGATATKNCEWCGERYDRHRSFGKEQWAVSRFCSRQCRGASIKGISTGPRPKSGTDIPCGVCGKLFYVFPYRQAASNQGRFCSQACSYEGRVLKGTFKKGHPDLVPKEARGHSEETKRKISKAQRINPRRGSDSPNWKGGTYKTERQAAMGRWEYQEWRWSVFKRDNFTCQSCHERGGALQADHIKPWSRFPGLRYNVSNGRTLCVGCHRLTSTWGAKVHREVCHG